MSNINNSNASQPARPVRPARPVPVNMQPYDIRVQFPEVFLHDRWRNENFVQESFSKGFELRNPNDFIACEMRYIDQMSYVNLIKEMKRTVPGWIELGSRGTQSRVEKTAKLILENPAIVPAAFPTLHQAILNDFRKALTIKPHGQKKTGGGHQNLHQQNVQTLAQLQDEFDSQQHLLGKLTQLVQHLENDTSGRFMQAAANLRVVADLQSSALGIIATLNQDLQNGTLLTNTQALQDMQFLLSLQTSILDLLPPVVQSLQNDTLETDNRVVTTLEEIQSGQTNVNDMLVPMVLSFRNDISEYNTQFQSAKNIRNNTEWNSDEDGYEFLNEVNGSVSTNSGTFQSSQLTSFDTQLEQMQINYHPPNLTRPEPPRSSGSSKKAISDDAQGALRRSKRIRTQTTVPDNDTGSLSIGTRMGSGVVSGGKSVSARKSVYGRKGPPARKSALAGIRANSGYSGKSIPSMSNNTENLETSDMNTKYEIYLWRGWNPSSKKVALSKPLTDLKTANETAEQLAKSAMLHWHPELEIQASKATDENGCNTYSCNNGSRSWEYHVQRERINGSDWNWEVRGETIVKAVSDMPDDIGKAPSEDAFATLCQAVGPEINNFPVLSSHAYLQDANGAAATAIYDEKVETVTSQHAVGYPVTADMKRFMKNEYEYYAWECNKALLPFVHWVRVNAREFYVCFVIRSDKNIQSQFED